MNTTTTSGPTLEARARDFATKHHDSIDHRRKYTGEPYITHPAAVAELVRSVPHTEAMLAAAWLHDVVEDTPATLDELEREFGAEVAGLVEMLTDISRPEDGNRAVRKAIDRAHTAKASPAAKTIKLADLIDNTKSIVAHDPAFAKVYLAEKALLLDVLRDGNPTLWALAYYAAKQPSWLDKHEARALAYAEDPNAYIEQRILHDLDPKNYGGRSTLERMASNHGDPRKPMGYTFAPEDFAPVLERLVREGAVVFCKGAYQLAAAGD